MNVETQRIQELEQRLLQSETALRALMAEKAAAASDPDRIDPQLASQAYELLVTVFENIQTGIAYLDCEFNFIRVNRSYAETNGIPAADFVGKNHFDLFPGDEARAVFQSVIDTGISNHQYGIPFRFPQFPERGVTYWNWSIQPVRDPQGSLTGLLLTTIDVTEQKRAEMELQESRQLFERLFESAPDATLLVDENGKILALNRQTEQKFGYERAELVGKRIETLIPERYHRKHAGLRKSFMREPLARPMGIGLELWAARKDGSEFPVDINLSPASAGASSQMICVVRDITRRKAGEKALQRQIDYIQLMQDIAVAANEAESVEEALQAALNRVCEQMKWNVGHALIKNPANKIVSTGLWHLDDPAAYEKFRQASEARDYSQGNSFPRRVLQNGKARWLYDLSEDPNFARKEEAEAAGLVGGLTFPLRIEKELVGVLEFFSTRPIEPDESLLPVMDHIGTILGRVVERDRSRKALLHSEARFRTIFEESAIGIQLNDVEGFFIESNPALQEMLGYTGEELRQLGLTEITCPEDLERTWGLLKSLLRGERDDFTTETRYVRKDGSLMWAQLTVSSVYDRDGVPQFVVVLVHDISEQKRMAAELEEVQRKLLESGEKERLRLARELHDGPLQDLYGATFQLQDMLPNLPDPDLAEKDGRAVEIIQQVISSLRGIVGELRPPTLAPFGLEKAVRSHVERLSQLYPDVEMHVYLMNDGQSLSDTARLSLYRIYQQLISNMLRHSGASQVWVRLMLSKEDLVLEVEDDGQGFELPGRWVELAREGRTGLLGVQERAESMGGRLEVSQGSGGRGACVRVVVPFAQVAR